MAPTSRARRRAARDPGSTRHSCEEAVGRRRIPRALVAATSGSSSAPVWASRVPDEGRRARAAPCRGHGGSVGGRRGRRAWRGMLARSRGHCPKTTPSLTASRRTASGHAVGSTARSAWRLSRTDTPGGRTRFTLAVAGRALGVVLPAASPAAGPKGASACSALPGVLQRQPAHRGRLRQDQRGDRRGDPRARQPERLRPPRWLNAPGGRNGVTTLRAGDTLRAVNEGSGEVHSFTGARSSAAAASRSSRSRWPCRCFRQRTACRSCGSPGTSRG